MSYYGLDQLRESMVKILNPAKGETAGSGFIIRSDGLIAALNHYYSDVRRKAAEALAEIGNAETLAKLIKYLNINIYNNDIFPLARTLAVRFSKENLPFIPVYPKLVRFSYSPILATVKRRWREQKQKARKKRLTG